MRRNISNSYRQVSILLLLGFILSCSSPKLLKTDILYFQKNLDSTQSSAVKERLIQINDLLKIQILSKTLNQEQTKIFNAPNTDRDVNHGYLVNLSGNIEMPLVGSIKAVGLSKSELQNILAIKLNSYVKDPSVIVTFFEFKVNVLGEVKSPGIQSFNSDRVTIIDAISAAGDLTDYGKREDVMVIRDENNVIKQYSLDLRNGTLFQSPAYELLPNDIVYVGANFQKVKSINNNAGSQKGLQLFLGVTSVASALIFLLTNLSR